jgi:hypothetical protein
MYKPSPCIAVGGARINISRHINAKAYRTGGTRRQSQKVATEEERLLSPTLCSARGYIQRN